MTPLIRDSVQRIESVSVKYRQLSEKNKVTTQRGCGLGAIISWGDFGRGRVYGVKEKVNSTAVWKCRRSRNWSELTRLARHNTLF